VKGGGKGARSKELLEKKARETAKIKWKDREEVSWKDDKIIPSREKTAGQLLPGRGAKEQKEG